MEGIESRLNSNNPVLVAQAFSQLVQTVLSKYEKTKSCTDIAEVNVVKEKCLHPDLLVSGVAVTSIICLVEKRILEVKDTLADFVAMIPTKRSPMSLSNVIGNLLYLEMIQKIESDNKYECSYNLYFPQHPFILLLNESSDAHKHVYKEVKNFYHKDERLKLFAAQLFRPVYLYTICSPTDSDTLIKQRLWSLVLNYEGLKNTNILFDILCWLQMETLKNIEVNAELLSEALSSLGTDCNDFYTEILILMLTSILYHLALNRLDVRTVTYKLKSVLQSRDKNLVTVNCILLMLAKSICVSSSAHLSEILELCEFLVKSDNTEFYALETLRVALLFWIGNPSLLVDSSNKIANNIFLVIDNKPQKPLGSSEPLELFQKQFKKVIKSNSEVFNSVHLCLSIHKLGRDNVLLFIKNIEKSPIFFTTNMFYCICGLFVYKHSPPDVILAALSLIIKCVTEHSSYKHLSSITTMLILFKLSNTKHPDVHIELLRALPKMMVLQENMPKVISTIQAVSKGSNDLHNMCTKLMFDAWKVNNKCYPYLERMLLTDLEETTQKGLFERNVTKAFVFKELCENSPELHGKELVAHLSKILNECNDSNGELPCALAIEGISILCQAQVIDVVTTWANLSPKFKEDTRIRVIRSLCQLIAEIPQLPYTEEYTDLTSEVLETLWNYVVENQYNEEDETVVDAALTALTKFKLEDICLHMPPNFMDDDKELELCLMNKPLPMLSDPNWNMQPWCGLQVLSTISLQLKEFKKSSRGGTWVTLQLNCYSPNATSKFVTKLMSDEISGFLKYVYQVKGHKEPENYNYLPRHSIVRGICNYVKKYMNRWKDLGKNDSNYLKTYKNCVKIMAHEYSKPLPPLDWCFLQELMQEPDLKMYCIDIASHQVVMSGSARRFIENFIVAVTEKLDLEDIICVYKNLKYLANSLQPTTLKPFFEATLERAVDMYKENEMELLPKIIENLKLVLKNQEIQPTNKNMIAQVLKEMVFVTDVNSEVFEEIIQCLPYLPSNKLEEATQCSVESFDKELFVKTVKIRCLTASTLKSSPLNLLNEVIEVASQTERDTMIFKELLAVFKKNITNTESAVWLLEFFGQIQAKVAERCDVKEISYYYDVLMLAVVAFSGYFVFLTENGNLPTEIKDLFPQALTALLNVNHWSICTIQTLEWLYHMNSEEIIPAEYRNIFGIALCCLRHDEEFTKSLRWLKYLNCKFDR